MKKIICILIPVLLALPAYPQDLSNREQRKLDKLHKKEHKVKEAEQMAEMVASMVQDQRFVLEATYVKASNGSSFQSNPMLNFVAVDSLTGVFKLASSSIPGANQSGHRLVEGDIHDYTFSRNKKNGRYDVTFKLRGTTSYDFTMTVYPDGRAKANLHTNISGSNMDYTGKLVPPGLSQAYRGTRL
jgi:hypothetical protein